MQEIIINLASQKIFSFEFCCLRKKNTYPSLLPVIVMEDQMVFALQLSYDTIIAVP